MLEISRGDIVSSHIQTWNTPTIQLPIEPYLKLLPVGTTTAYDGLNRPQIALINAVNSPHYRFITCAYSRRLGKTFISNVLGQLIFLIPNKHVLIMSPNYSLSNITRLSAAMSTRKLRSGLSRSNSSACGINCWSAGVICWAAA